MRAIDDCETVATTRPPKWIQRTTSWDWRADLHLEMAEEAPIVNLQSQRYGEPARITRATDIKEYVPLRPLLRLKKALRQLCPRAHVIHLNFLDNVACTQPSLACRRIVGNYGYDRPRGLGFELELDPQLVGQIRHVEPGICCSLLDVDSASTGCGLYSAG